MASDNSSWHAHLASCPPKSILISHPPSKERVLLRDKNQTVNPHSLPPRPKLGWMLMLRPEPTLEQGWRSPFFLTV